MAYSVESRCFEVYRVWGVDLPVQGRGAMLAAGLLIHSISYDDCDYITSASLSHVSHIVFFFFIRSGRSQAIVITSRLKL